MNFKPTLYVALFTLCAINASALEITDLHQTLFLAESPAGLDNLVKVVTKNDDPPVSATITLGGEAESVTTSVLLATGEVYTDLLFPAVDVSTSVTVTLAPLNQPQISRQFTLDPVKHWTVFAVPSTHTDIGYTEGRADVMKRHNRSLDQALEYCYEDPTGKWNLEVSWEFQNYMALESTTKTQAMLDMMHDNRMGLHAGYLNMLTALMSDEAMNRYCMYTADLGRAYNLKTKTLILSDVPTATWAIPAALAGSGIRYFAEGCNMDRGPMLRNSGINNPFYWQGPDGSKVLTVLSMHYAQSAWLAEIDNYTNFQEHLAKVVQPYIRDDYPSDAIYLYGAFLDNRPFNPAYGRFLHQYAAQWAYPKIKIATSDEFFEYLEAQCGDQLETKSGDFGAFWEDGAGSTAFETIQHMENQRRLVAAETLFSLAAMAGGAFNYPTDRLTRTWEDVLFYIEHTWGAAESISQPDSPMAIQQWTEKSEFPHRADAESKTLVNEALIEYAVTAGVAKDEFAVVNPLGFARGGMVNIEQVAMENPIAANAKGETLPVQIKDDGLLVYVKGVPAFGHDTITLKPGSKPTETSGALDMKNEYYHISADQTKGITSIIDRESGKQLLDTSGAYGFGQVVYALGGEGTRMIHDTASSAARFMIQAPLNGATAPTPPAGDVFVYPANITAVEPVTSGPLFSEIAISSTAPSMPDVRTTVRLYHQEKHIEVEVDITSKTEERRKEAVYVAFPLAMPNPEFRFGMTNAITNPAKDFFKGGCHEWYCVQDFVTCRSVGSPEILWSSPDAPLLTLSELNRGTWKQAPELTTPTIFSYVMNNYWHTNYKAGQGGDFRFRYNFTSGPDSFSTAECLRFARSAGTPLLAAAGRDGKTGKKAGALLPAHIAVSGESLIPSTIRKATDNRGYILRIRNPADQNSSASVTRNGEAAQYKQVNLVENDLEPPAPLTRDPVSLSPHQTVTLYLPEQN